MNKAEFRESIERNAKNALEQLKRMSDEELRANPFRTLVYCQAVYLDMDNITEEEFDFTDNIFWGFAEIIEEMRLAD